MFYSQTFLARKGPLSTVWIAAHLQHRLKKSDYTSTNIESIAEHILDPAVPIALRMSGHLLLGLVRIYSKKVDYLFHDSNVIMTVLYKSFALASVPINLPEDARQAPVQSITLPDTFDLDTINLDTEPEHTGVEDIHQRSQEEITLTDPVPVQMDHYIAISFDEDIMMDSSHTEVLADSGAMQMEKDTIPQSPLMNVGFQDSGPSIQRELPSAQLSAGDQPCIIPDPEATCDLGPSDNPTPQATLPQPIEIVRDENNDCNLEIPPIDPVPEDQDTEPIGVRDETMNEKGHNLDMIDEVMADQPHQLLRPSTPATSQGAASDAQVGGGHSNPNLVLRASPPIQQPQRRGRKRKLFFDEPIVLTNKFMRGALNNTRDILRKRRDVPSSTLATWKLNNFRKKEKIFDQPIFTGFCKDLLDIFKKEYICSKPNLVISEEDHEDAGIARTPSPTNPIHEESRPVTPTVTSSTLVEMERLRGVAAASPPPPAVPAHNVDTELNIEDAYTSPVRKDDLTPSVANLSVSSPRADVGIGTAQTPYLATSPGAHGLVMETPDTFPDDTFQNFVLSETHQLINSAATEELSFLEADTSSPASSQFTSGGGTSFSARTRAVAQYLKRPITPILEDPAEDLSLNKILEGRSRKVSARLFFEVLVLKSHGLVDVQQEEPYGDVSLKLTDALKSQF